jgi:Tfp pilus assembly protein PilO
MPGPGGPGPGAGAGAGAGKLGANIKLSDEQKKNIAVAAVFIILAVVAYVKFWFTPVMKTYKEKTQVLEQKKKDLKDAREMVSKYSEFMARQNVILRNIDFINRRLPQENNISDTIRELTSKATESNISLINFQPGREVKKDDYKEFNIDVSFDANYKDLGKFLTQIGYVDRLTTPSNIAITGISQTSAQSTSGIRNIHVTMTIKIYSFPD